ncbi:MAG: thioredoxin domain-containing protein, partial [Polyangiaceae bacterium]|nr:thioredoxin domain-containing protein [Polyangiaceae bacterium]
TGAPAGARGFGDEEGAFETSAEIDAPADGLAIGAAPGARGAIDAPALPSAAKDGGKEAGNPISVSAADPSIGKKTALVTIVQFADFQCPFCRKAAGTMTELRKFYGDRLRIVWKNYPLPFHKEAQPAAETAMALFESGGDAYFWGYHDAIFGSSGELSAALYEDALKRTPMTRADVDRIRQKGSAAKKVEADVALAKRLGVTGTPAFFINGVYLSGAQSIDKFQAVIDAELIKAKELLAAGVPQVHLYDTAASKNFIKPENRPKPPSASKPAEDDKTVHLVPVGTSPVRGKASALVTLVVFSDFQCPFCIRAVKTTNDIEKQYGDKIRLVFKHNPLPFHPRAEPAAELAIEARLQKGDAGFWKAHDLLWDANGKLAEEELADIAKTAGLRAPAVAKAIETKKHKAVIEADQDLADDLGAHGTPTFFINGRRLVGAQPIEKFQAIIDEEIAKAQALVAGGLPANKVYDAIQKNAVQPKPPEKKTVPAPTRANPSKGAAGAKVTIQVFSDFQCPYCKRVEPTIASILEAYPGKVRVIWRNTPLPFHKDAALAAEAAVEAFRQKGDAGFWKMHGLLFEGQANPGGLERPALEKHAAAVGLDMAKFTSALDSGAHKAEVEQDISIAKAAGISGTPAFVINGYFISGAQPFAKFRKIIDRALKEAK